jgi:hypothetical protein
VNKSQEGEQESGRRTRVRKANKSQEGETITKSKKLE